MMDEVGMGSANSICAAVSMFPIDALVGNRNELETNQEGTAPAGIRLSSGFPRILVLVRS